MDTEVRASAAAAACWFLSSLAWAVPRAPAKKNVRATLMALINSLSDRQPSVRIAATRAVDGRLGGTSAAGIDRLRASDERIDQAARRFRLGDSARGDSRPRCRRTEVARRPTGETRRGHGRRIGQGSRYGHRGIGRFYRGLSPLIPSLVESAEKAALGTCPGYLKLLGRIRPPNFSGDAVPGVDHGRLASKDKAIVAVAANDLLAFEVAGRTPAQVAARSAVPHLIAALNSLIDPQGTDDRTSDPVYAIVEALGQLAPQTPSSEEAVAALARVLRIGEGDTRRRVAAARALGRFRPGNALFTALTDTIEDKDVAVRLAAIGAMHDVEFGAPFVIPKSLGAALEDESADVRTASASALWRAGTGIDAYVPALLRHAERDANDRVREVCAGTLQHVAHPRYVTLAVLPDLMEALASRDATVRFVASEILAACSALAAAPAITRTGQSHGRALGTQRPLAQPRAAAAKALGRNAPAHTDGGKGDDGVDRGLAS